jgi:predicted flap endonuclease-1-like 5' DNA nuclease
MIAMPATPEHLPTAGARSPAAQDSASRAAERERLRLLRAERLARLRNEEASTSCFDALAAPAAVLHFHRSSVPVIAPKPDPAPAPEPACDLDRLPGVGPDLVWALTKAGLSRRADIARLEADDLAVRLGAIGRLAPVEAWIADARAAAAEAG